MLLSCVEENMVTVVEMRQRQMSQIKFIFLLLTVNIAHFLSELNTSLILLKLLSALYV